MTDQTIEQWVAQAKAQGLAAAGIRTELKKQGWDDVQIEAALTGGRVPEEQAATLSVSPQHKRLGILFICLPFAVLVFCLFVWAIVSYVARMNSSESGALGIIQWALGFISMIAGLSIFVLVPVGIILLVKKSPAVGGTFDARSGAGPSSVVPPEIQGWNWGAGLLTPIWGIYYNAWIALLCFAPVVNWFWWIVAGIKGNEWAWRANKWESVEQFLAAQNKWKPWGIAALVVPVIVVILIILLTTVSFFRVSNYNI